jgi:hypothetical protein
MPDILHNVGIRSASVNDVYNALTRWKVFPRGGRAAHAETAWSVAFFNSALAPAVSTSGDYLSCNPPATCYGE